MNKVKIFCLKLERERERGADKIYRKKNKNYLSA